MRARRGRGLRRGPGEDGQWCEGGNGREVGLRIALGDRLHCLLERHRIAMVGVEVPATTVAQGVRGKAAQQCSGGTDARSPAVAGLNSDDTLTHSSPLRP